MTLRLVRELFDQRIQEVVQQLRDHITRDEAHGRAGWHNAFRAGRIGPTGTALPVLFLIEVGAPIPERDAVLNALRMSQIDMGDSAGWSILSLGEQPNVEGTAWPLRALVAAGDGADRSRILRAEAWLLSQQNTDGGWGSSVGSVSRLTLTSTAVSALLSLPAQDRRVLDAARVWIIRAQNSNGSWGATIGESGTLHHTCLAVIALLALGSPRSDDAVVNAAEFVRSTWRPSPRTIQTEVYDAHYEGEYRRVVMEHDVDALVSQLMLRTHGAGDFSRAVQAAHGCFSVPLDDLDVEHVTLWNIIPRALIAQELRELPGHADAHILSRANAVAFFDGPRRHQTSAAIALVIAEMPWKPARPDRWLLGIAVVVIASLLVLLLLRKVSGQAFAVGVLVPFLLAAWTVVAGRRRD